jgi:hypothetical protein
MTLDKTNDFAAVKLVRGWNDSGLPSQFQKSVRCELFRRQGTLKSQSFPTFHTAHGFPPSIPWKIGTPRARVKPAHSGSAIFRSQNPSIFRLESRTDTLLSEKRYFSRANMTTESHVKLLSALDKMTT